MTAQRGLLIVHATARGKSSHPAHTPGDTKNNAIMNAADDLCRIRDFDWGPAHPLLGQAHAHVTMMSGGVAKNVIPDRCEFWLDIRTTPLETHRALFERLQSALQSELRIHSERLVPVHTAPEAPIVQAVLRALPGVSPQGSRAMSDMVFLSGIPAVKIGPGHSPRSHTPDEFILESELLAGAAAYEEIIREFFGGPTI
jgi:acetylornithine deacetylase